MPLGGLLKKAADAVVQGALVSYYFVYYLVKGHENEDASNQQQLETGRTYSNPPMTTPPQNAWKPPQFGHTPPSAQKAPKQEENGWLSLLNPKNWFSASKCEQKQEKPVAPPRHFKSSGHYEPMPNGSSAPDECGSKDDRSWISKAMDYLPSLSKKEEEESTQMPTRRILRVVATTTSSDGSQERTHTSLVQELKHAIEPHYPVTLSGKEGRNFTAPPAPPVLNPGQTASIQIHVQPKSTNINVKPDDAWMKNTSSEQQKQVIWTPNSVQPHAASIHQVQMQRQQLRKTNTDTTVSPVPVSSSSYEPEESGKSVKQLRRQWPPPSNASGVEIVKDLVFPSGVPGDLSSALMDEGEPTFNYDSYRPSSRAERSYEDGREEPRPYERSPTSPERFRDISQELTSKSAGKGVELFVRRRQAVDNWAEEHQRPIIPSSVQRMVPVAAPRKRISANEVAGSVVEAASRKEYQWQAHVDPVAPIRTDISPPPRRELERVVSPTPAVPSWRSHERHERFFSPQPFNSGTTHAPSRERLFTPPPRTHEPKIQHQAHRSMSVLGDRMEQKEFIDWSTGPETTTTVVKATSPQANRTITASTYTASRGSQYTKTSTYSLPRTWKSYSEAYRQPR